MSGIAGVGPPRHPASSHNPSRSRSRGHWVERVGPVASRRSPVRGGDEDESGVIDVNDVDTPNHLFRVRDSK